MNQYIVYRTQIRRPFRATRLRGVLLQSAKLLFPILFPASSLQLPVCQSGILTYSCLGFSNLGLVTVYWTPGMGDNPNLTLT